MEDGWGRGINRMVYLYPDLGRDGHIPFQALNPRRCCSWGLLHILT